MKAKTNFIISVETPNRLNNEVQMELLAHIRNAMRGIDASYPELKIVVTKEVTNDDIMEAIRTPEVDGKTIDQCYYYDEAQGRHLCINSLVVSKTCQGVCKFFHDKNKPR